MLDPYIGECMGIINQKPTSTMASKNLPTHGCQNCNANPILIFSGCLKVRESLYTEVIIWVNTILNHIDTMVILPRYDNSCSMYLDRNGL